MQGALLSPFVHRWADAVAMPWRNGGGVTRELLRRPALVDGRADDFDWRLSVAEVATDGPFSAFDGYDRVLVLLDGAGMDLHIGDDVVSLRPPLARHRFAGEAPVRAVLVDGPTSDLNLMWRRAAFDATVRSFVAPFDLAPRTGATLLAFVVDGAPTLDDVAQPLAAGDVVESTEILHVDGDGTVLVLMLLPR